MNTNWSFIKKGGLLAFSLLVGALLAGCGGSGGGSGGGTAAISATATTTAQNLTVGTVMTSFSPLVASGGVAPDVYSVVGTLPAGLILNASTGDVTGTPTAVYPTASLVFSVKDANGVAASTTSTVDFSVGAASATINATANTTAQSLTVGTAMASFSPLTPSGGVSPYFYSNTGTLPAGLNLNSVTGAVTGTPTSAYTTASVVFSVRDANGVTASTTSTVSFTVVAAGIAISATANATPQSLMAGTAMASFTPLTASGGTAPYTYIITSGTLPVGLSLNASTGAVTGTPTATYTTASLVFSVRDANNNYAGTTSTVSFTVVAAAPTYVVQGGLTWMPVSTTLYTYTQATILCAGTINGSTGWRLPTQLELSALYSSGAGNSVGWTMTWSSTPYPIGGAISYNYWVDLFSGTLGYGAIPGAWSSGSLISTTCVK